MTGGTARASEINRELASIAEERGYAFGLGSQRAMLRGDRDDTYQVRDVAPNALVLGNIGAVQARELSTDAVADLVGRVGADALCVHMNPAQEIVQPGGDRYFAGALGAMERLAEELGVPVVAKETGCGIGPRAARRIARAGVRHVDVSGAGGTSWVAVETERAAPGAAVAREALREWGVPTAASVIIAKRARPRFETIIATGRHHRPASRRRRPSRSARTRRASRGPCSRRSSRAGAQGALRFLDAGRGRAPRRDAPRRGAAASAPCARRQVVMTGELLRWAALVARASEPSSR